MSTGRRIWTLAIASVIGLALTFVLKPSAVGKKPPKTITIDGCKKKKPPVKFEHAKHIKRLKAKGMKCTTCHHKIKGKAPAKRKCTTCHAKAQKDVKACNSSSKKNPFHIRCRGCHKKEKKGPTKCKLCHKK